MTNLQKGIKILAICFGVFLIVNILGGVMFGISIITGIDDYISSNEPNDETESNKLEKDLSSYKDINNITIDLKSTNLEILKGTELKLESNNLNHEIKNKVVNNTLKIEETGTKFWNHNLKGTIILYIPESFDLNKLKIDAKAGSTKIDSINTKSLELDQGAGKLSITNSTFNKTEIEGGAGSLEIKDSILNDLDLDAGVGKVLLEGTVTGTSKIECGVGAIDLNLYGGKDSYKLYLEKGIGSIRVDGDEYKNDSSYGEGENKINIHGGVGSIKVEFE